MIPDNDDDSNEQWYIDQGYFDFAPPDTLETPESITAQHYIESLAPVIDPVERALIRHWMISEHEWEEEEAADLLQTPLREIELGEYLIHLIPEWQAAVELGELQDYDALSVLSSCRPAKQRNMWLVYLFERANLPGSLIRNILETDSNGLPFERRDEPEPGAA